MTGILVAPDKFKGSLSASRVAAHLARGIRRAGPGLEVVELPVADGGDGTVDAAVAAGFARRTYKVSGPTGEPRVAAVAIRGDTAVVELAQASGLARAPEPLMPLHASSFGTGELLRAVAEAGCRKVVLGLGGSACTDGGAGMLQALGVRLRDRRGRDLQPGGAALRHLDRIDTAGVPRKWGGIEVVVASDVDNPLLGATGAAAVFGPQKGAGAADVAVLEAGLAQLAHCVHRDLRRETTEPPHDAALLPGAGAAGGVGYAALAFLGAQVVSGIDLMLDLVGFTERLDRAALVVTGEGRLDRQTLHGKAPAGVAKAARRAGVPVIAVAGVCDLPLAATEKAGFEAVHALSELEPDPEVSMREAGALLERVGERIAADRPNVGLPVVGAAPHQGGPLPPSPPSIRLPANHTDSSDRE